MPAAKNFSVTRMKMPSAPKGRVHKSLTRKRRGSWRNSQTRLILRERLIVAACRARVRERFSVIHANASFAQAREIACCPSLARFEVALWCYQFTILGDALIFFLGELLELALECSNAVGRSKGLLELLNLAEFQARSYGLYQAVGAIMLPLLPLFLGQSLIVDSFLAQPLQIHHGEAVNFHPRVDPSPITKAVLVHP